MLTSVLFSDAASCHYNYSNPFISELNPVHHKITNLYVLLTWTDHSMTCCLFQAFIHRTIYLLFYFIVSLGRGKGRYRYAGQWKHGRMHGCGVYEVNEQMISVGVNFILKLQAPFISFSDLFLSNL